MRTRFAPILRLLVPASLLSAAGAPDGVALFEKKIRPVLVEHCYACHGTAAKTPAGGLRLDSADGTRAVIAPGDPAKSLILSAIRGSGALKMPPGEALSAAQVADFEEWIRIGAPDPRTAKPAPYDLEKAKRFWSFQPVKDPLPPRIDDPVWNKTAIDRFIKAKLDRKKLRPMGLASKRALIRRATFDLTGLPPNPNDVAAFLADTSAGAFDKVIDRLLATPQYGERWGRQWLDVVRYADTAGDNSDYPVPDAYRYRNWVIQAFNAGLPYDEFLREQIAGDLLEGGDHNAKVTATGYLAISRRFGSGGGEFHLTIDDTIDNLGKTMLGLSIGCARCHDHKFDPISSRDYYALYGIFESTRYAFPGTELFSHQRDFTALGGKKSADRLKSYEEETSALQHRIQAFAEGREGSDLSKEEKDKEVQRIKDRIIVLEHDAPEVQKAYAVSEGTPIDSKILIKGNQYRKGDQVMRGFLQVLGGQTLPLEEKGSGRRELAGWIADRSNPLMARVMVNRIWQHHFGRGIVGTPNDFGARGDAPVNPELLDWLASRFRESGYSVKAMDRLIMKSHAYRMDSGFDPRDARIDPKDDFLWRFNRRRLDAEEIRDALLDVAGDLDFSMGGRHPFPPETTFQFSQHRQFFAVYDTRRRSVYLMQQRLRKDPFLETFDGADPNASTASRAPQETSLQALTMMNSAFVEEQADLLAVRVGMAYSTPAERINYAYRLVYGRAPLPAETAEGERYLLRIRAAYKESQLPEDRQARAALASLMHVLLASDEFVFVD